MPMSQLNQQLILNFRFEPCYTFSNFVRTPSTQLAYNAALSFAQKTDLKYSSLCIYGGKGVGKTHLLKAIGNESSLNFKEAEIIYVGSKNILADQRLIESEFDLVGLTERYYNVDFLIMDDIDLLLEQPNFDEKVFHLYNHLAQRGKKWAFTCSTPPHQLGFSDENLKSRLKSSFSVKIEKMQDNDRREVIKKLSKDFELFIPTKVIDYILNCAPRDFKSLHEIVSQLNKLSFRTKKRITLPLAKQSLKK